MKYIIPFILLGFLLTSCNKSISEENQKLYTKIVNVSDSELNTVEVEISSVHFDLIENFDTERLILHISKDNALFSTAAENTVKALTTPQDYDDKPLANTIFIDAISFEFNEDVRGFFVNLESIEGSIDTRTETYFAFGASGVRGAFVQYDSENRASCYLDIDLAKRSFEAWFWSELADGDLQTPVSTWAFLSGQEYDRYRLRVNSQGWRCANDSNVSWQMMWICPLNPGGDC